MRKITMFTTKQMREVEDFANFAEVMDDFEDEIIASEFAADMMEEFDFA